MKLFALPIRLHAIGFRCFRIVGCYHVCQLGDIQTDDDRDIQNDYDGGIYVITMVELKSLCAFTTRIRLHCLWFGHLGNCDIFPPSYQLNLTTTELGSQINHCLEHQQFVQDVPVAYRDHMVHFKSHKNCAISTGYLQCSVEFIIILQQLVVLWLTILVVYFLFNTF